MGVLYSDAGDDMIERIASVVVGLGLGLGIATLSGIMGADTFASGLCPHCGHEALFGKIIPAQINGKPSTCRILGHEVGEPKLHKFDIPDDSRETHEWVLCFEETP